MLAFSFFFLFAMVRRTHHGGLEYPPGNKSPPADGNLLGHEPYKMV
jgi:hypothetical protein